MTFTTLTFLVFLGLVFGLYWAIRENRAQKVLLLICGYVFYGWWDYRFCSLMLASSLADYTFGRLLARYDHPGRRRSILVASCAFNLGLLGLFKYWHFFAESLTDLMLAMGMRADVATINVILPVGISFYTFQSMSYIIDVYRRQLKPTSSLLDYLAYVAFFPQLLAGPIERGRNLLHQFQNPRHFDYDLAVDGLRLILWGFFKKIAIADNLAVCADQAYSHPSAYNGPHLVLATVCFAFQIYCDFSGYSDIALGTAQLLGVRLMRNFAYPYFSQSVSEFWRRWHISLSTWFRDYLYFPLGGNRVSRPRLIWNLMTTFVLSGLWHGAAWTYVFWGGLNGVGLLPRAVGRNSGAGAAAAPTVPGGPGLYPSFASAVRMTGTFAFICVTWIFFRAHTFGDAFLILKRIVTWPILRHNSRGFDLFLSTKGIILMMGLFVLVEWFSRERRHPLNWEWMPPFFRYVGYTVLIWTTLYLGPLHLGNFIYFQF